MKMSNSWSSCLCMLLKTIVERTTRLSPSISTAMVKCQISRLDLTPIRCRELSRSFLERGKWIRRCSSSTWLIVFQKASLPRPIGSTSQTGKTSTTLPLCRGMVSWKDEASQKTPRIMHPPWKVPGAPLTSLLPWFWIRLRLEITLSRLLSIWKLKMRNTWLSMRLNLTMMQKMRISIIVRVKLSRRFRLYKTISIVTRDSWNSQMEPSLVRLLVEK